MTWRATSSSPYLAEWSNAVTETYALVHFHDEEEEATEKLSKLDNQTGIIKLDNAASSEEEVAHDLANIKATLSHGEDSKCTSDGQYLAGTMSIQVSLPPLPEKFKALAGSALVTVAKKTAGIDVNSSTAAHAFEIDTSLTLASTSVTGARRCGSDIRHLGRYSLTMPVTGETIIPITGAVTLRLTQTMLQLKVGRCRLKRVDTSVESAWCQCLMLEYDGGQGGSLVPPYTRGSDSLSLSLKL